jgi:chromosome segregation ATPase
LIVQDLATQELNKKTEEVEKKKEELKKKKEEFDALQADRERLFQAASQLQALLEECWSSIGNLQTSLAELYPLSSPHFFCPFLPPFSN